jgi:hypothetical protein
VARFSQLRPIGPDGTVEIVISVDHRVIDGGPAARAVRLIGDALNGALLAELNGLIRSRMGEEGGVGFGGTLAAVLLAYRKATHVGTASSTLHPDTACCDEPQAAKARRGQARTRPPARRNCANGSVSRFFRHDAEEHWNSDVLASRLINAAQPLPPLFDYAETAE